MRTQIKRALIAGYCRHLLPAWFVSVTFKALRLKGLSIGADDYMVKPPNKQELLLRIQAILRRAGYGDGAPKRIKVRSSTARVALIDPATVAYLEAENNFCWAYTTASAATSTP